MAETNSATLKVGDKVVILSGIQQGRRLIIHQIDLPNKYWLQPRGSITGAIGPFTIDEIKKVS